MNHLSRAKAQRRCRSCADKQLAPGCNHLKGNSRLILLVMGRLLTWPAAQILQKPLNFRRAAVGNGSVRALNTHLSARALSPLAHRINKYFVGLRYTHWHGSETTQL